jgi:hypothetical protein
MKRKNLLIAAMAAMAVIAGSAGPAFGQTGPVITVDEQGNMTINGVSSQGVIAVDPISGMTGLSYTLPFAPNPGDILMFATNEPPVANRVSDLVRFIPQTAGAAGRMFFFSLKDDGEPPDLADVPVLPTLVSPSFTIEEIGPEGLNGSLWTPGPGGIGGDPLHPTLTYNFISDSVPEPASVLLATLGGGLLLALRWRQQARRS